MHTPPVLLSLRRPLRLLCSLAAVLALSGPAPLLAEAPPGGLPPELAPLAAKYQADLAAVTQTREKALAQLQQPYLTALDAAAQKASTENKTDELKTITAEKETLTSGRSLADTVPPLLPHNLWTPRAYLLREAGRTRHEFALREQQAAADYLRGLTFYETKAKAAGQTEMLKQIEAEKQKLAAADPSKTAHPGARELVTNGDFAGKKPDGGPQAWNPGEPGRGAVTTEQGVTFLRMVSGTQSETYFLEEVERPADAQELAVSVRLRCHDMKGAGKCGIVIAQRDGENKLVGRDFPCILTGASPGWRPTTGAVKISPNAKRLIIRLSIIDCKATVDFADVHVEAH